jgi:thioredoxin 1
MSEGAIIEVSPENWQHEVMQSEIPVVLDFWAQWCVPCKAVGSIIEELAGEFDSRIKFAKVNVETNQDIAQMFSVSALPTLLIVKEGIVQEQMVGGTTKARLTDRLSEYL